MRTSQVILRVLCVLVLAAVAVGLVRVAATLPTVCPAIDPAPASCGGGFREGVAGLVSVLIAGVALACVAVTVARRRHPRSRAAAGAGVALAIVVAVAPLVVIVSAGFAVDASFAWLVLVPAGIGIVVVLLTRPLPPQPLARGDARRR